MALDLHYPRRRTIPRTIILTVVGVSRQVVSMANAPQLHLVFGPPQRIPQGDGAYLIKPGRPVEMVTVRQACEMLGLKKTAVYTLIAMGELPVECPAPKKTLIPAEAIERHRAKTRDPEYWERQRQEKKTQRLIISGKAGRKSPKC